MRGARTGRIAAAFGAGIIPADAGSTLSRTLSNSSFWDHPRECGEHPSSFFSIFSTTGSSPRMRGAPMGDGKGSETTRIIPADAGSTRSCWTTRAKAGDHPRGCGEHIVRRSAIGINPGSSPRMRGALSTLPLESICTRDHPRGCGEHTTSPHAKHLRSGSSPRMRGAPGLGVGGVGIIRIIPADAGSTLKDPCNPNNMIDKISDF